MSKEKIANEKLTLKVEISNLTLAQAIAIEDMMRVWVVLGSIGSSRWTSFYADGDGNFRPRISINGEPPKETKLLSREEKWNNEEYRVDFDSIAWKLREI